MSSSTGWTPITSKDWQSPLPQLTPHTQVVSCGESWICWLEVNTPQLRLPTQQIPLVSTLVSTRHFFNADKDYTRSTLARVHELLQPPGCDYCRLHGTESWACHPMLWQGIHGIYAEYINHKAKRQPTVFTLLSHLKVERYDIVPMLSFYWSPTNWKMTLMPFHYIHLTQASGMPPLLAISTVVWELQLF